MDKVVGFLFFWIGIHAFKTRHHLPLSPVGLKHVLTITFLTIKETPEERRESCHMCHMPAKCLGEDSHPSVTPHSPAWGQGAYRANNSVSGFYLGLQYILYSFVLFGQDLYPSFPFFSVVAFSFAIQYVKINPSLVLGICLSSFAMSLSLAL